MPKFFSSVKQKDIVIFSRQFATMIDAGLPLVQCLDILSNQQESRAFKEVLTKTKVDVEGGSTFAEALRKHPKAFDDLFVNLVQAGEVGGILDTIFLRLANYLEKAEKLKKKYGCALTAMVNEKDVVDVPRMGGRQPRLLSLQVMAEILQPRADEIFSLIREEVGRAGFGKALNAGVVLTGGGAVLPGMVEVAEQVFDVPVRVGSPTGVEGLVDPDCGPAHCTAVGLALYGARHRKARTRPPLHPGATLGRVGGWLRSRIMELF